MEIQDQLVYDDNDIIQYEKRSEEADEVLGAMPNWIVRWGMVAIVATLLACFAVSFYVRFPDTVSARVYLSPIGHKTIFLASVAPADYKKIKLGQDISITSVQHKHFPGTISGSIITLPALNSDGNYYCNISLSSSTSADVLVLKKMLTDSETSVYTANIIIRQKSVLNRILESINL